MDSECNRKLNMSRKISGSYLFQVVNFYRDIIVYYLLPHCSYNWHVTPEEASPRLRQKMVSPAVPLHPGCSNTVSVTTECALDQLWWIMAWRSVCWSEIVSILRLLTPWASTTLTYVLCILYFSYAVSCACCFKGSLSVQWKLSFLFWHMENTSYTYYDTHLLEK